MAGVTIEESDDEKAIVTPGLRLRFRWTGDRWTHAIDFGPGPEPDDAWPRSSSGDGGQWLTIAEAIEWERPDEDPGSVVSPVFQDLHIQAEGSAAVALLVGQAGPHHFSASFRVTDRIQAISHAEGFDPRGLEGYLPQVDVDVADRCSEPISSLGSSYQIHAPFRCYPILDGSDETGLWPRPHVLWESNVGSKGRHDFVFGCPDFETSPHQLRMTEESSYGPWKARLSVGLDPTSRTQRYTYYWYHDCRTAHFADELRLRDPSYDAQLRRAEADREDEEAKAASAWLDPNFRAWAHRMGYPTFADWVKGMGIDPDRDPLRDQGG